MFLPSLAGTSTIVEIGPCLFDFILSSWSFSIDGACVLEEDKDIFVEEWKKAEVERETREKKKREDRALKNWKKFIQGILRLHHVKNKFGHSVEESKVGLFISGFEF